MPGRRKAGDENVRSLTKTSNGSSYAVTTPREKEDESWLEFFSSDGGARKFNFLTLPKAVIREFGWKERQKLQLTISKRGKSITIKDWKK